MSKFFKISNLAGTPIICIDGIIGPDADYVGFRNALNGLIDKGYKRLKLVINSGGGDMVEGFAIFDLLKASGLTIEVEIIGMAASMGGILAQIASPGLLSIHSNASIMTHKPTTGIQGESDALRSQADFADKLEARAVKILTDRKGLSADQMKDWFKPGIMKWFTAQEAVAAGLADYIINDTEKAAKPANSFNNMNEAMLFYNSINLKTKPNMKKILMVLATFKITNTLTEESTDEQVSVVVENALKDKDAKITELQALVDAGKKASATTLVEAAIKDGKIKAESKDKYIEMATTNFDNVKELLDGLQGRVNVKNEIDLAVGKTSATSSTAAQAKTYEQHSEVELRKLKTTDMAAFKALFKAQYGEEYEG